MANRLAKIKSNNMPMFPELQWGANPQTVNGVQSDVNSTVGLNTDLALVGDFANALRWGYAKDMTFEVI